MPARPPLCVQALNGASTKKNVMPTSISPLYARYFWSSIRSTGSRRVGALDSVSAALALAPRAGKPCGASNAIDRAVPGRTASTGNGLSRVGTYISRVN